MSNEAKINKIAYGLISEAGKNPDNMLDWAWGVKQAKICLEVEAGELAADIKKEGIFHNVEQ
jgi:hypothetical protein